MAVICGEGGEDSANIAACTSTFTDCQGGKERGAGGGSRRGDVGNCDGVGEGRKWEDEKCWRAGKSRNGDEGDAPAPLLKLLLCRT